MKRRIIINLVSAFIILPLIVTIRDYIRIDVMHDKRVFSGSYFEYFSSNLVMLFLATPAIFLIFILLPYNIWTIQLEKKRSISLPKKILIFELICLMLFSLFGTFSNVWLYPYWRNIYTVLYFLPLSILFATLIHLYVDRKVITKASDY